VGDFVNREVFANGSVRSPPHKGAERGFNLPRREWWQRGER